MSNEVEMNPIEKVREIAREIAQGKTTSEAAKLVGWTPANYYYYKSKGRGNRSKTGGGTDKFKTGPMALSIPTSDDDENVFLAVGSANRLGRLLQQMAAIRNNT